MKMILIIKSIGIFLLISISQNLYAQAHLEVKTPRRSQLIFNCVKDNTYDQINFFNGSNHDSVIAKEMLISMPTHIFFSNLVVTQINKPAIHQYGSLLIFPGDSITLDRGNFKVNSPTGYKQLLDSILDMSELYTPLYIREVVEKKGIGYSLQHIENTYQKNQGKIDSLKTMYDIKYIRGISLFNLIIKYSNICGIRITKQGYSKHEKDLLDSCYNTMMLMIREIASINSPFSQKIIYHLTAYNALKKGNNSGNIWNNFQLMDKETLFSEAYSSFLLFQLITTFDGITSKLENNINLIRKAGIEDKRFDSLLRSKQQLSMQVMDSSLLYMPLQNMKGKLVYLKDILEKGKIVYLDIWASWCGPCIAEIPYLKKEAGFLKDNKIKYIGLSIDKDQEKWVKSVKTNVLDEKYQFIIVPAYKEKLEKVFKFKTIPRYVMLSYPDNILFIDAPRPSDSSNLYKFVNIAYENLMKKYN